MVTMATTAQLYTIKANRTVVNLSTIGHLRRDIHREYPHNVSSVLFCSRYGAH